MSGVDFQTHREHVLIRGADADNSRSMWRGTASTTYLIASECSGERVAMLATSVASVSLDPPSLLTCVNRDASAYAAIRKRGAFSLGILSSRDYEPALHLSRVTGAERFRVGLWQTVDPSEKELSGLPWLATAQATAFCKIETAIEHGTHVVFMASIAKLIEATRVDPLLYCNAKYGAFQMLPDLVLGPASKANAT